MILYKRIFSLFLFALLAILLIGCNESESGVINIDDDSEDLIIDDYETEEDAADDDEFELVLPLFTDMLTPLYYNDPIDSSFVEEVNLFVYYAQRIDFSHPLGSEENMPEYNIPIYGIFGAGKGFNNESEYHSAIDMYIGDSETNVLIYASHDGIINVHTDSPKYRNHITITTNIYDTDNNLLGQLVTIYAHIDLALDESLNLFEDGQVINKGDLISMHLYEYTLGGPHLHFEIRYYRIDDLGTEEFMGSVFTGSDNTFTIPSSGPWEYGYWDPAIGYGYGNPKNFGIEY